MASVARVSRASISRSGRGPRRRAGGAPGAGRAAAENLKKKDIDQADVMADAFSANGVFSLAELLRDLAEVFIRVARGEYQFSVYWANATWQANFWSLVIELAMGLWLIFGSRGIVRIVLWARYTPRERGDESADSQPAADNRPGAR